MAHQHRADVLMLPIRIFGDPALRRVARDLEAHEIDRPSPDEESIAERLATTLAVALMRQPGAVGIAAPQLGMNVRLCLIAPPTGGLTALVNPHITIRNARTAEDDEGCLSIPGCAVTIARAIDLELEATDLDGNRLTIDAEGYEARIICHELDHLDGRLICDHIPPGSDREAAFERWVRCQMLGLPTDEQAAALHERASFRFEDQPA